MQRKILSKPENVQSSHWPEVQKYRKNSKSDCDHDPLVFEALMLAYRPILLYGVNPAVVIFE